MAMHFNFSRRPLGSMIGLHIGGAGVEVGARLWKHLCREHNIDLAGNYIGTHSDDLLRIESFFQELHTGVQCPRALFLDLDDSAHRVQDLTHLFPLDGCIFNRKTTGNNFALGYMSEGSEQIDLAMERIRRLVEECDVLQGNSIIILSFKF